MKLNFDKESDTWFSKEHNVFFHMPFLKGASDGYLKRVFRTDFKANIDDETIQKLRNPKNGKDEIEI
jgi:hypothetical protein